MEKRWRKTAFAPLRSFRVVVGRIDSAAQAGRQVSRHPGRVFRGAPSAGVARFVAAADDDRSDGCQ
jgi:hypothetical protein